jgi:hypothetical protein
MPHIWKTRTSKASCSQDQVKAALAAVKGGTKIEEFGLQFDILETTLREKLKLN